MSGLADPKDKLVLVVDDDRSVVQLFELALLQEGFRVATATDGSEALEKTESLKPDLVLLDLMLPEYGGTEVLELMRRRLAKPPAVVVITGRFGDEPAKEAIRRLPNVAAYLEKPVRPAVLAELLHGILGTRSPGIGAR